MLKFTEVLPRDVAFDTVARLSVRSIVLARTSPGAS